MCLQQIHYKITLRYQQHRRQTNIFVGFNNTLLTSGPMGFEFKSELNMKTKQERCYLDPREFRLAFFLISQSVISLCIGRLHPTSRAEETHTRRNTQEAKRFTRKKKKKATKVLKRKAYFPRTRLSILAYTDTQSPISGCCQQGDGSERKHRRNFFSASFYHTTVTPLFTSSIYLHTDCLAPQRDCDWESCGRVCMCAGLKCMSAFTVMEDS